MARLEKRLSHILGQDEALKRIKELVPQLKRDHADKISIAEENWEGGICTFRFTAASFLFSGTLYVRERDIVLDGMMPSTLGSFRERIEDMIQRKGNELLRP